MHLQCKDNQNMKYTVDFQYMPKDASRPLDQGTPVDITTDEKGFTVIPNVGDYVSIEKFNEGDIAFAGKVKSRLFVYLGSHCHVNIVVEETEDSFGALMKQ
jgi:hypothetical protein